MAPEKPHGHLSPARARPPGADAPEQRLLRGLGRTFQLLALVGLVAFGLYIVLRATGASQRNFGQ